MKKHLPSIFTAVLMLFLLLPAERVIAQCPNDNSLYFTSSVTCNTAAQTISSCTFGGEYILITGIVAGNTYVFATCGDTDFDTQITLYNDTGGAALAYNDDFCGSQSQVTWLATFSGSIRVLIDQYSCLSNSSCMTIMASCTTGGSSGGCNNGTVYPLSSVPINSSGSTTTISSCSFGSEYSVVTGAVSGQTLRFTYSYSGGYITVRSGSSGGPVVAEGLSPLSFSNTYTGTLYAHWNSNAACGTNSSCSVTTVQCSSCAPPPPTCPAGLGTGTVTIASLPYSGTGLTNCGNGNNITSGNATVCGSSSYYGGEDKTFIFTPTVSGTYEIVLTTASSWSGLMLYAGCPLNGQGGTCIANSQSSTGNKTITQVLNSGTTYYLVVDSYPSPNCHSSFNLSIAPPIPPCNAPGIPVVSNITSTGANVNFAAAAGAVNYDWTIGTGGSCPTGTGANTSSTALSFNGLIPNTTYRVCVRTSTCGGGAASAYVTTTFTTAPLPNDACSGAITVSCGSTINGNTFGAASDAAMGSCGIGTGGSPGNGLWYKLTGNGAQATISLCGSSYDTKLHVYSGTCAGLTCLASNDDFCGSQSQVVFNANVGTDYYILVSGFSSATGPFSMNISCICGPDLGAPWTTTSLGGVNGGAIENVCDNTIDISSSGYSQSAASDALMFAHQNLCGNQTITVKINNISNGGFAGIMFRESSAAGSKMVAIKTQLNNFILRELRSTTGGARSTQQVAAFGHSWLRLVRSGNTFSGFRSNNGTTWQLAFNVSVSMNSCMQVGIFTQGLNPGSMSMASFGNVSGFPSAPPPTLPSPGGDNLAVDMEALDFTLFPNPAQTEINVQLGNEFIGKAVTIRVSNQLGQTVMTHRITEVQNLTERLQLNNLSGGLYILSIQTEGLDLLSKKFVVGDNRP